MECVAYRQTMNIALDNLLCSHLVNRDVIESIFNVGSAVCIIRGRESIKQIKPQLERQVFNLT
jgi:hypothetical protein